MSWYGLAAGLARAGTPLLGGVRVEGAGSVPRSGPFFVVANHGSVLDPILLQSRCPRVLHTFTKSSQFRSGVFRWLLPRIHAIPVRRYQVDPQAVRVALRRLRAGEGVCIYPEGERAWDGELQPFREGTLRLLLRPGVPVVPAWISGSYHVWPRWSRTPARGPVRIRFGAPLDLGVHRTRTARDQALPGARDRLREALLTLADETPL